jgi:hypothetical protein
MDATAHNRYCTVKQVRIKVYGSGHRFGRAAGNAICRRLSAAFGGHDRHRFLVRLKNHIGTANQACGLICPSIYAKSIDAIPWRHQVDFLLARNADAVLINIVIGHDCQYYF